MKKYIHRNKFIDYAYWLNQSVSWGLFYPRHCESRLDMFCFFPEFSDWYEPFRALRINLPRALNGIRPSWEMERAEWLIGQITVNVPEAWDSLSHCPVWLSASAGCCMWHSWVHDSSSRLEEETSLWPVRNTALEWCLVHFRLSTPQHKEKLWGLCHRSL